MSLGEECREAVELGMLISQLEVPHPSDWASSLGCDCCGTLHTRVHADFGALCTLKRGASPVSRDRVQEER